MSLTCESEFSSTQLRYVVFIENWPQKQGEMASSGGQTMEASTRIDDFSKEKQQTNNATDNIFNISSFVSL